MGGSGSACGAQSWTAEYIPIESSSFTAEIIKSEGILVAVINW
jgi:hypothetical protein